MAQPRITTEGTGVCGCRGLSDCTGACHQVDREQVAAYQLIDEFADAIKQKFDASREKGRAGWDHCDWSGSCIEQIHNHAGKGDARDVGLLAAFLWNMREGD